MIRRRCDEGSSLPFVLLCFLIAAVLVAGVTAASAAFLAQRDLQADCDGAAVAAASGADLAALYARDPSVGGQNAQVTDALPLAAEAAQRAVEEYRTAGFDAADTFSARVEVDEDRVTVGCERVVTVPFGMLFGVGDGLERSTVSTARMPVRP